MKKNNCLTIVVLTITFLLICNISNAQKWTYYKDNTNVLSTSLSKDGTIWLGTTDGIIHITSSGTILKKYTQADGLPNDYIAYVYCDKDDNLWAISYDSGVYKFDGKNWIYFVKSVDGVNLTNLNSICQDKNNNLWFAGDGQIVKFDGKKWVSYNSNSIGTNLGIYFSCCFQDKSGNMWFGSYAGGGAIKYDGINWKQYVKSNSGIGFDFINQITEDLNGIIWFATSSGISKFDNKNWIRDYSNDNQSGLNNDFIKSIFIDKKGEIWAATPFGEFYKFDGKKWVSINLSNTKIKNNRRIINSILQDNEGAIWINATSKFDGISWKDLDFGPDEFSIHDYKSSSSAIKSNGTYWFGTGTGISIYDGNKWQPNLNVFEQSKYPSIEIIFKDRNNNIWVTNSTDGVIKISPDNQKVMYNNKNSGISSDYVSSICEHKNGYIWISTFNGISFFNGSSWSSVSAKTLGLADGNFITRIIEYKGNLILGINDGTLIVYDGVRASLLDIGINKNVSGYFSKFFIDSKDNLWICNINGVWMYDGKNTTTFNNLGYVADIKQDKQNNLWFVCNYNSSKSGIYKFDGKSFTFYNPSNGSSPAYGYQSILIDEKEQLWFGSYLSMSVYCPSESPKFNNINASQPIYEKQNVSFQITASNVQTYQWQVLIEKNSAWQNIISSDVAYEGQLTNSLTLKSAQVAQNNNKYRCLLINGCNEIFSNIVTLSVLAILGTQNEIKNEVVIYPNPANGYVKIDAPKGHFTLSLINNNGTILKQMENQNIISTEELPNGIYYLNIQSSKGETSHKFIILR